LRNSTHLAQTRLTANRFYRRAETDCLLAALQAGAAMLVVAEAGMGKSHLARGVAEELRAASLHVALVTPSTPKQSVLDIAQQLGVAITNDEGRPLTQMQLQADITTSLSQQRAYLLVDDAHRLPISLRVWLEQLLACGQPLVLFATHPPRKDIFLKLPRLELKPLDHAQIRELMREAAEAQHLALSPAQLATLQERTGGNPMLARRALDEERLGLDATAPDHTEWMDGTPLLLAVLLIFSAVRFLGRGLHQTDLYLLGGFLAVAVGIIRLLLASLPRRSNRLGK
jgi:AAA domain